MLWKSLLCSFILFIILCSDVEAKKKKKFNTLGDAVHEMITAMACARAKAKFKCDASIVIGTESNDLPCEDDEKTETCGTDAITGLVLGHKAPTCTLPWRNNYGDRSHHHSMAQPGTLTNQQVLDKIVDQAKYWWNKSDKTQFFIGKIMHMVEDGFSKSHVIRDDAMNVIKFQRYGDQDGSKHSTADASVSGLKGNWIAASKDSFLTANQTVYEGHLSKINRAIKALEACTSVLNLRGDKGTADQLETLLRTKIYPFAKGAATQEAGGSDPEYSCGAPNCGITYQKPNAQIKINVVNKLTVDLHREQYGLTHGCWSCFDKGVPAVRSAYPEDHVPSGTTHIFQTESCGAGVEGAVEFETVDGLSVVLHFADPLIGGNQFTCEPFCHVDGKSGYLTEATFTISPTGCEPKPPSCTRSTTVKITNNSGKKLHLIESNVVGEWAGCNKNRFPGDSAGPCLEIESKSSCTFRSDSTSGGESASVKYREVTGNPSTATVYSAHWDNPLAGYNTYKLSTGVKQVGDGRGNHANVEFQLGGKKKRKKF